MDQPVPVPAIVMQIILFQDGAVRVDGVPPDSIIAYGLLKKAEKAIDNAFSNKKTVIPIVPGIVNGK